MRAAAALVLAVVFTASVVEGALISNRAFAGCANLTAITDPELQAAVQLIKNPLLHVIRITLSGADLDLLPAGIPDDYVIFLPTNDSLREVLVGGPVPTPSSDMNVILSQPLIPEIAYRLNAILLYHMAHVGAATADELAEEELVRTALDPDQALRFATGRAAGTYTVTDATGRAAITRDPLNLCGSSIFAVDKVLLPADSFVDIPLVSPREALCLLTGLGCRAPALSVDSPSSGGVGVPAPAPAP